MLPSSLFFSLNTAADTAISKVLAHGGIHTPPPRGEVTAVRTMTLDGFNEIATNWSPILKSAGYQIKLVSVFCHSRPQVTFTAVPHPNHPGGSLTRRCELADLLIVIDHEDSIGPIQDRRAVLVQAKLLKSNVLRLSGGEWIQHELLGWLPAFTFVDAGYDPRIRDFKGSPLVGKPTYSAEYGGIDLTTSPPVWRQELTMKTVPWFHSPISLANFLAGMATGDTNCSREAVSGGLDDWSFTVDELLRFTATRVVQSTGPGPRGNTNVVGLMTDTSISSDPDDGGWDSYIEGEEPEWPEGPISVVHMTIHPIDERADE